MVNKSYNRPPEDLTLDDLSSEEIEMVKQWHLPEVKEEFPRSSKKTSALGRPVDWYYGRKQRDVEAAEEAAEQLKPLTLEEIEVIRQQAYEEGILQGHEEGFEKGYAEGKEQGHKDGIEKGTQEGIQQGLVEGRDTIEAQVQRWQQLTHQLNTPLFELNEVVEQQLVALAVELAEAVIEVEVKTNPVIIFNTLKACIEALPMRDTQCEMSFNPADLVLINEQYSEQDLADKGWRLKSEPTIEQGGCIVESRTSSIDRTLKERVKNTLGRFMQDAGLNKPDSES